MLKAFIAGIVVTIAGAVAIGYLLLQSGRIPANADATPGPIESWIANTSLDATLTREAPKGPNPIATTDENLIDGINLYGQHCAICHGTAKGSESASPVAKGLYPSPPQLATDGVEDDPEGVTFWKIEHWPMGSLEALGISLGPTFRVAHSPTTRSDPRKPRAVKRRQSSAPFRQSDAHCSSSHGR